MTPPKIGVTYVMIHPALNSVKVGYTHAGSNRMHTLQKLGWRDFGVLILETHRLARDVEQAALLQIRCRLLVPVHLTPDLMPAGWTETVSATLLPPLSVWDVVCDEAARLYMEPAARKIPGRRGPKTKPTPPRRRPGDTPPYSSLARTQARLERTVEKKD